MIFEFVTIHVQQCVRQHSNGAMLLVLLAKQWQLVKTMKQQYQSEQKGITAANRN